MARVHLQQRAEVSTPASAATSCVRELLGDADLVEQLAAQRHEGRVVIRASFAELQDRRDEVHARGSRVLREARALRYSAAAAIWIARGSMSMP
jgi:hypothetical protein